MRAPRHLNRCITDRVGYGSMAFDGRSNIIDIDDDTKTVIFETWKPKKISGTKIGGIFGFSEFSTPFKVACEIGGLYPGDKANKYIDAGNFLEPVLRDYLGHSSTKMLREVLSASAESQVSIEMAPEKDKCQYDHFHDNKLFGGMVDGYIRIDGKRDSVLEIKTSNDRDKWLDESGNVTKVPMSYQMQASLYAELAGLKKVVFLVGFLSESDYAWPARWKPSEINTSIIVMDKLDMSGYMKEAEEWYKEYILNGYTPEWTDKDKDLLKYLRAGVKHA